MREDDASQGAGSADPVPATAAVCGLYCDACWLFIACHELPETLPPALAARWKSAGGPMHCDGCRTERRVQYCEACTMFKCAAERGHAFCVECDDYPCAELKSFQSEAPHRAELFESLRRIAEVGGNAWHAAVRERYACPSCGTLNSAYQVRCRRCGHDPASGFVASHREAILERLSRYEAEAAARSATDV
jgi:hypothetical protein